MGAEQAEWLQRLEEEHENLRAALDWSLVEAGSGGGLRLCGALRRFWWTRGHLSEGAGVVYAGPRQGRRQRSERRSARTRSMRRATSPLSGRLSGRPGAARGEPGDPAGIGRPVGHRLSLNNLGNVASTGRLCVRPGVARGEPGDHAGTGRSVRHRQLTEHLGNVASTGRLSGGPGAVRGVPGDHAGIGRSGRHRRLAGQPGERGLRAGRLSGRQGAATRRAWRSAGIGRSVGHRRSLNILGNVARDQGDYPAARALYQEGLAIRRELGERWGIAQFAGGTGRSGRFTRAPR